MENKEIIAIDFYHHSCIYDVTYEDFSHTKFIVDDLEELIDELGITYNRFMEIIGYRY